MTFFPGTWEWYGQLPCPPPKKDTLRIEEKSPTCGKELRHIRSSVTSRRILRSMAEIFCLYFQGNKKRDWKQVPLLWKYTSKGRVLPNRHSKIKLLARKISKITILRFSSIIMFRISVYKPHGDSLYKSVAIEIILLGWIKRTGLICNVIPLKDSNVIEIGEAWASHSLNGDEKKNEADCVRSHWRSKWELKEFIFIHKKKSLEIILETLGKCMA